MAHIKQLAHLCIFSSDLARTEAFYCGALGLRKQFRFLRKEKLFGYYLKITGTQFIEVFERTEKAEEQHPKIAHLCLEVDDIAAFRAKLLSHQIECTEPFLADDQSWQFWCKDPDGTSIEFHQYTDKSCQLTGADCIVNW